MKKKEIARALAALKEIKMPKIEDKGLRSALIKNHLTLLAAGRKLDEAIEDKRTVFTGAYGEEAKQIADLQDKFATAKTAEERRAINEEIGSHKDYLQAVSDLNASIDELCTEEVEGLDKIDSAKFIAAVENMDNFCLEWNEAIYPMFDIASK